MSQRNVKYPISYLICPDCDKSIPIPRVHNQREKGHLKDMYCPYCKEVKTMEEIRSVDYLKNFLGEYIVEREVVNG